MSQIKLYRYKLAFKSLIRIKPGVSLSHKAGFLVHETNQNNWLDISPLPCFSNETLETLTPDLITGLKRFVTFDQEINQSNWLNIYATIAQGLNLPPSLVFFFEMLLLNRVFNGFRGLQREDTFSLLIDEHCAVLPDLSSRIKRVKLKWGRDNFKTDWSRFVQLAENLPAEVQIVIDLNRTWDFQTVCRACQALEPFRAQIAWIEEPLIRWETPLVKKLYDQFGIPIAIDESLDLIHDLKWPSPIIVFKPTLQGGYKRIQSLMMQCPEATWVLSSAHEHPFGLQMIRQLAYMLKLESALAIDTMPLLEVFQDQKTESFFSATLDSDSLLSKMPSLLINSQIDLKLVI